MEYPSNQPTQNFLGPVNSYWWIVKRKSMASLGKSNFISEIIKGQMNCHRSIGNDSKAVSQVAINVHRKLMSKHDRVAT